MLEILQGAAAFNAQLFGAEFVITDKSASSYDPVTNEVVTLDAEMTVNGIWHEGVDKAVSKNPDGGVTIVRGSYRALEIPALDKDGNKLAFLPKKGDLIQRAAETYVVDETMTFAHGAGNVFHMIYLQGA